HSPTVGFSYHVTPTLVAAVNGGAAITTIGGGDTFVSPAGSISLTQFFQIGSAGIQYSRGVGVAGGFGGTTDTQTASATLILSTLARGLLVAFSPRYSAADSFDSRQRNQVDVKTFTLPLHATHQLSRYLHPLSR